MTYSNPMNEPIPQELVLIAGRGAYPLLLAESARKQGVKRVFAIVFRRETEQLLSGYVDEVVRVHLGQAQKWLDTVQASGIKHAVLAGLITPTHLFSMRLDAKAMSVIRGLNEKHAHSIFGAVVHELAAIGVDVLPANTFMEAHIPSLGLLSARPPTEQEKQDIDIGLTVADRTSGLNIGQTVVIKEGTILAVEAFEGTDATIRRAGKLARSGLVVVKVAKRGHDMRFDIPTVGMKTMQVLKRSGVSALAVQAGRAVLLEKEKIIEKANQLGICLLCCPNTQPEST